MILPEYVLHIENEDKEEMLEFFNDMEEFKECQEKINESTQKKLDETQMKLDVTHNKLNEILTEMRVNKTNLKNIEEALSKQHQEYVC